MQSVPEGNIHERESSTANSVTCLSRSDSHAVMQSVPGGKVDILGGHSIGHSKKTRVLFRTVSEIELLHCTLHCTLYRRATRHVLTPVAKCIDVDGGILLY
jgi:hypothetical protein